MLGTHHFGGGEIVFFFRIGNKLSQDFTVFGLVQFVHHKHHRHLFWHLFQHRAVGIGKAQSLNHKHNHIDTVYGFGDVQVQAVV